MIERAPTREARRRLGVHDTPPDLAMTLVRFAASLSRGSGSVGANRLPRLICDPACGNGRFLLAAADHLLHCGVPPEGICTRLVGFDVDPGAVSDARIQFAAWCRRLGIAERHAEMVDLRVLDALTDLPADLLGRVDLVVGNPPFLAQRMRLTRRSTTQQRRIAERFAGVSGLTDTASVFLLLALDLLVDGGSAMLIQPMSFLSTRDSAEVRERLLDSGRLVGLWGSDDRHFDAGVSVCAPVITVGARLEDPLVQIAWGAAADLLDPVASPVGRNSWGPLLSAAVGLPMVSAAPVATGCLGSLAQSTAGFRDEFYALSAAAVDVEESGYDESAPALVTVGMIDPARNTWGVRDHRLAGRNVLAPRLDLRALTAAAPGVARWVERRMRPKVLVATQTRVVEAVADPTGALVPVTPTVSVEPHDPEDVWLVLAALLSPLTSVRLAAEGIGSGRAAGAQRVSASALAAVPLPVDQSAWRRGAVLAKRLSGADGGTRSDLLGRLGRTMCAAGGQLDDCSTENLLGWWLERAQRT